MYEIKYRDESELKDSGIEWTVSIPSDWHIKKLRYLSTIDTGNKDTQDRIDDGEYPFYVRSDTVERINSFSFNGEAVLTAGDGVGVGRVFHYVNGKFAYHQRVYKLSDFSYVSGKYLFYYVSENFHKEVMKLSAKSTVDSLRRPMFSNFPVVFPISIEQQKIVNFLDIKIAQFDNIIAKKEQLIKKIEEAKKSLISEVVTGKVKIVDGQWVPRDASELVTSNEISIGKMPFNWRVVPLKRLLKNSKNNIRVGPFGSSLKGSDMNGTFAKVYTQKNVIEDNYEIGESYVSRKKYNELQEFKVQSNRILVTTRGTIGRISIIPDDIQIGILHPCLIMFDMDTNKYDKRLIKYLFNNSSLIDFQVRLLSNSTIIDVIYSYTLKELKIPIPLKEEIAEIVKYLDKKTKEIDRIILSTNNQLNKLAKAKQSLIFEAVTGKIDLRDWEIIEEGELQ